MYPPLSCKNTDELLIAIFVNSASVATLIRIRYLTVMQDLDDLLCKFLAHLTSSPARL